MCEYAGTVWCTREIVVLLLAAGLVCGVVACGAAAAQAGVRARAASANGVAAVRTREVERDFRLITVPPVTGVLPDVRAHGGTCPSPQARVLGGGCASCGGKSPGSRGRVTCRSRACRRRRRGQGYAASAVNSPMSPASLAGWSSGTRV